MVYMLENVSKCFLDGDNLRYVFRNVNMYINRGDMISLKGESGSGKSTFLSILGLLDYPSSGRVLLNNIDIMTLSNEEKMNFHGKEVGFVLQNNYLLDFLNVIDNIVYPLVLKGINKTDAYIMARQAIEKVGLLKHINKSIKILSGGEKQRVCIARAIASNPSILLADEPTGNLDKENANEIIKLFKQLNEGGITMVVVTHNDEFARQFKRKMLLSDLNISEY